MHGPVMRASPGDSFTSMSGVAAAPKAAQVRFEGMHTMMKWHCELQVQKGVFAE